jgi:hypothetical protein
MKPGDERTFRKSNGNAVVLAVGLWAARDGMHLRIDMTGADTHTTVTNGPGSAGNHRILFRDLRKVLMANGCWEFSDEVAEAQATGSAED